MADGLERCENCRHWDTSWGCDPPQGDGLHDSDPPRGVGYYDTEAREVAYLPGQWGDCQGIKHLGGSGHSPWLDDGPTEDPAFLSDGSGYFASLTTRADFGCALWAGREVDGDDPNGTTTGG